MIIFLFKFIFVWDLFFLYFYFLCVVFFVENYLIDILVDMNDENVIYINIV